MEPIRRKALIRATILEIGEAGSLDVTVAQIARRAGVSSALAHHYFGCKDSIFLAAMRHILTIYGELVRDALRTARSPRGRLEAIIRASFEPENFRPEVISAWLNFYVLAQSNEGAERLLAVYQRRLSSNLIYNLRPLMGEAAVAAAETLSAMIDGFYIRDALRKGDGVERIAGKQVLECLDLMLQAAAQKEKTQSDGNSVTRLHVPTGPR